THQQLSGALQRLTAEQRLVILYRFMEDRSIADTARLMAKNEDAIKQLQVRALRNMRRSLATAKESPPGTLGRKTKDEAAFVFRRSSFVFHRQDLTGTRAAGRAARARLRRPAGALQLRRAAGTPPRLHPSSRRALLLAAGSRRVSRR